MEGSVDAADRRGAMAAVEKLGYVPISVSEVLSKKRAAQAKADSGSFWKLKIGGNATKMKPAEVLLFTSELSDLLEAGMTLGAAHP